MAESVKDLVVRLSFEHGDTKSQIAAIKNEIKLLDSGFQAAAATAGGFSGGLDQAAARAQLLRQQIALQEQAVQKYGTAIQQAQQQLQQAQQRQQDYTNKLQAAKQRHAELTGEIDRLKAAMAASKAATGENTDEYIDMAIQLEELEGELEKNNQEIRQWESSLKRSDTSIANADRNIQRLTIAQNQARAASGQMRQELDRMTDSAERSRARLRAASEALQDYADSARNAGQWQESVGRTLTKGSTAIVAAGVASAGAAISWETSCADMEKTISGTAEQLEGIEQGMLDMSQVKPVDPGTLGEIAANAGQLGIATDNVLRFTGVMADLEATTDLTAETGASSFAKFANVTQMAQSDFDRLGSVVVDLGNNTATTESAIVAMGTNLASAGHQIGMTEAEIMGMAAALSSLGLEAQGGGTAFSRVMVDMQVAAETGSADLKKFADVAGMSAQEFATLFKRDAAGAIAAFVQGLASGSQSAIVMLDEMGITETRMRDALLRASNASDLFTGCIDRANNAWNENTALAKEAEVRYGTTASKMTMMGNKAKAAAIKFGNDLLPAIGDGIEWVDELLDKFNALDEGQRKQIMTWAAYAAAVGPAIMLIGKANNAIGNVAGGLSKLVGVAADAGGGLGGVWAAVRNLLGPAGIAALAVGATAATVAFVDWASGAKAAREATEALIGISQDWKETQATTMYDTGTADPLARFGLSADSFKDVKTTSQNWLDDLKTVWSDGQKETDAIVQQFVDSFVQDSDSVRSQINSRGALLEGLGLMDDATRANMDADLAQLDAYDTEIATLLKKRQNGMLSAKDQARLDEVIQLRAELQVEYGGGDLSAFDQVTQGMQAEIDRALAMGAEADASVYGDTMNALAQGRQSYMDAINASYNAQHAQIMGIQDETQRQEALNALNAQYNAQRLAGEQAYRDAVQQASTQAWEANGFQEQIAQVDELAKLLQSGDLDPGAALDWAQNIDEGKLTSMIALIEQMKAAGVSDSQFAAMGIDVDDLYSKLQQIRDITGQIDGEGGQALHDMFADALPEEVQRILVGLDMTEAAANWAAFAEGKDPWEVKMNISEVDEAAVEAWKAENADVPIKGPAVKLGVALGDGWASEVQTALDAGLLAVYGPDGKKLPLTPEVLDKLGPGDMVVQSMDGTTHIILTPELAPVESATVNIRLTPLDQAQIAEWEAANSGVELTGPVAKVGVELGADWQSDLAAALEAGLLTVTDENGVPVPVTPEVVAQITANDLAATEADGTIHIIVTPELGTKEAVEAANAMADAAPLDGTIFSWADSSTNQTVASIQAVSGQLDTLNGKIAAMKENGDMWDENGISIAELEQQAQGLQSLLSTDFSNLQDVDLSNIASQIGTLTAALANPDLDEGTAEQYRQQLQGLLDIVGAADQYLGTGNNVSAGIAQGLTAYGWDGDAATLATNIQNAINASLGVASPATTMVPTGSYTAAGIGQGMREYNFAADAAAVSSSIVSGFSSLPSQGQSIGSNFGAGLRRGLASQMSAAVAQARSYANQITAAFRSAWQIHSPSKVAENLTTMFGKGLVKGERKWPTVSEDLLERDIARLYNGTRRAAQTVDNSRSYDDHSSVNFTVQSLAVRDDNDVRALAYEMAGITRQRSRGYGKR